jgi:epoxyqueuosine reductase
MENLNIVEHFHKELELIGCKGRILSAKHITDVQRDIQGYRDKQLLDPVFYEEYKNFFESEAKVDFEVNSLFIISRPDPPTKVKFHWNKKELVLLVPPTYLHGLEITNQFKDFLNNILSPMGYTAAYARLPVKSLAVHSGLAQYGKNNITYVEGMGSFHRLTVFYSDFPYDQEQWYELRRMEICEKCSACVLNCPTNAIPTDRFLLRAERCLTYHNEHPPDTPFPEWIDPTWHNCLIGCLHCQNVCPANKKVKDWFRLGPEFSEQETKMILSGKTLDQLPKLTSNKLEIHDLTEYIELFPRNISVFLKRD